MSQMQDGHPLSQEDFEARFTTQLQQDHDLLEWVLGTTILGYAAGWCENPQHIWYQRGFWGSIGYQSGHAYPSAPDIHAADRVAWSKLLGKNAAQKVRFQHAAGHWVYLKCQSRIMTLSEGERAWFMVFFSPANLNVPFGPIKEDWPDLVEVVGQAVITLDTKSLVLTWNKAATDIYGWTREEALGRPLGEKIIPEGGGNMEEARAAMTELIRDGHWAGDMMLKRKDGSLFRAYVVNRSIFDKTGNIIGFVGVSTDISSLRRTEEALEEAQRRLELAAKTAQVGIWELTLSTGQLSWNKQMFEIYELTEAKFSGEH